MVSVKVCKAGGNTVPKARAVHCEIQYLTAKMYLLHRQISVYNRKLQGSTVNIFIRVYSCFQTYG